MELKYLINAAGDTATMRIYKSIGGYDGVSGDQFAQELEYLSNEYKKINIRINSPGGSVMEGYSIFSAILQCKATVHTYCDGVAASMAGIILLAGKKVFMADYSRFMMHDPRMSSGRTDLSEQEKNAINAFKTSLINIFEKRTAQDANTIEEMMSKETWLTASEALEKGFIDEVISYPNKRGLTSPSPQEENANALYQFYNHILSEPQQKPTNMNEKEELDEFKNTLGLNVDAKKSEVMSEIKSLKAKGIQNEALLDEITNLKNENASLKQQIEENKKSQAAKLIEDAIASQKIRAAQKEQFLRLALADFELAKETIEAMVTHPNFSQRTVTQDEKSKWTFKDYVKKAPKELERMKEEDPEAYFDLLEKNYEN